MWSSKVRGVIAATFAVFVVLASGEPRAAAQQQALGFDVNRLYLSAPGGGWFVMDTLDMHGGLGGAVALTTGYAHDALRVRSSDGAQRVAVVSDLALLDLGFAATYDRYRLWLDFPTPIDVDGQSGTVAGYQFTRPNTAIPFTPPGVNPSTAPDTFGDVRLGADARLLGSAAGPFRLGASAQLLVPSPNSNRAEYITDGSFRAMARVLFAGDVGIFGYAGQIGVHVRPLDDAPTPGSPQGSEMLFGVAAGPKLPLGQSGATALVVGPEVFGETALRSLLSPSATGVEALLGARLEGTADDGPQIRVKIGAGGGLDARFGAPEWRVVVGIELFDHHVAREGSQTSPCPPGSAPTSVTAPRP
jgi:hypothetical protein